MINLLKKVSCLFLLSSLLMSCTLNENQALVIPNPTAPLTLIQEDVLDLSEIEMESADDFFKDSIVLPYIEDVVMILHYYSDTNQILASGYYESDPGTAFVIAYDVENQTAKVLADSSFTSNNQNIVPRWTNGVYAILDVIDYSQSKVEYRLYNLEEDTYQTIASFTDYPTAHMFTTAHHEDTLLLGMFSNVTDNYVVMKYTISNNRLEPVADNACFPTYLGGYWFYIQKNADNSNELICYDLDSDTKTSIYNTKNHIVEIVCDGKSMVMSVHETEIMTCYDVDLVNKEITPLFTGDYIGDMEFEQGYLTWLGSKIVPDRARLQYYLYDYENDIHYLNKDGQILLAENGIVWNEYLKPELELEKGKTSTPGNSNIRFLSYPKN